MRKLIKRQVVRLPHRMGTMGDLSNAVDGLHWWAYAGDTAVSAARRWVTVLQSAHAVRRMQDAMYVGLYEGQPPYWLGTLTSISPLLSNSVLTLDSYQRGRCNLVGRCIDTAQAMLAKNPADVRCETDGASWKLQRRARQQTKFCNGGLREQGFHGLQKRLFVDGCISRASGIARFYLDVPGESVRVERLHGKHLVWNDYDGEKPQQLGAKFPKSRSELIRLYPELEEDIKNAPPATWLVDRAYRRMNGNEQVADMVDVYEVVHLGSKERPGRHIIALENCTLVDEEWPYDFFPWVRYGWADADTGWANRPVVDQLVGYQNQVAKMLMIIKRSQSLACVPRVWIEQGSEVEEDQVTNEIGGIGYYKAGFKPPTIGPSQALPGEFYQHLNWLIENAMSDTGLNQFQATGRIPAGLEGGSGKALREYNDTGSTRQVIKGQRLECMSVEASTVYYRMSAMLAERCPGFAVRAMGSRSYERISWRDVEGDVSDIRFVSNPVSALSSTTSGRIQDVTDLIKGGLLPPEEVQGGLGLKLLNFPDLEKTITMEIALREMVDMMVDGALYDGEYFAPEPYMGPTGLNWLKTMSAREYFKSFQLDGVPERNRDLLRRLMAEADSLSQRIAGRLPAIEQPQANVLPPAPVQAEQSAIAGPPIPAAPPPMPGVMPA
jgi:hypothetical protein